MGTVNGNESKKIIRRVWDQKVIARRIVAKTFKKQKHSDQTIEIRYGDRRCRREERKQKYLANKRKD